MTNLRDHVKLLWFSTNFAFFEVFLVKKVDKWPGVSQLAYYVRNLTNLARMSTMHGHAHLLENIGSFRECIKLDHFQRRVP